MNCIPDSKSDTLLDSFSMLSVSVSILLVNVSTLSRKDVILLHHDRLPNDRFSELELY